MTGDTIVPYYGEFLVSPAPLEVSFNYCSHKCAYCFANLNKPGRTADVGQTMRALARMGKGTSLRSRLLGLGYPVVCSNRVDPFAATNHRQALPVVRVMAESGVPIVMQTKGGTGADEAAAMLPPSVWYVSISTLDDDVRRRVEPGAPTISSRLELIESLRKRGHRVVVGLNPAVPEWEPDPDTLCRAVRSAGAEGAWVATLHLNPDQAANLSPREREALTEPIIKRSLMRRKRDDEPYLHRMRAAVVDAGMEVFSGFQANTSEFFRPWRECYERTFPVMQDLVNACHGIGMERGAMISADEFVSFFTDMLPAGDFTIGHYVGAVSREASKARVVPASGTFAQLLLGAFQDWRIPFGPSRSRAFALAVEKTEDGMVGLVDEQGYPYYVFDGAGHEHGIFDVGGSDG